MAWLKASAIVFSFLIEICDRARLGVVSRSDLMNTLEKNLSGVRIATLVDVFIYTFQLLIV